MGEIAAALAGLADGGVVHREDAWYHVSLEPEVGNRQDSPDGELYEIDVGSWGDNDGWRMGGSWVSKCPGELELEKAGCIGKGGLSRD